MPKPKPRIRWDGDVADDGGKDGGKDGYINEIRVARIHRTPTWEDKKPYCLDYAHGLHCEAAYFDTIREAMDATEGLISDFLVGIDADWLPPEERYIVQLARAIRPAPVEAWTAAQFEELWTKLHERARSKGEPQ